MWKRAAKSSTKMGMTLVPALPRVTPAISAAETPTVIVGVEVCTVI